MAKNVDVKLHVTSGRPRVQRGFRQATDADNKLIPFYYKFRGGKDDSGDVVAEQRDDELRIAVRLTNKAVNAGFSVLRAQYKLGSEVSDDIVFPRPRRAKHAEEAKADQKHGIPGGNAP